MRSLLFDCMLVIRKRIQPLEVQLKQLLKISYETFWVHSTKNSIVDYSIL